MIDRPYAKCFAGGRPVLRIETGTYLTSAAVELPTIKLFSLCASLYPRENTFVK